MRDVFSEKIQSFMRENLNIDSVFRCNGEKLFSFLNVWDWINVGACSHSLLDSLKNSIFESPYFLWKAKTRECMVLYLSDGFFHKIPLSFIKSFQQGFCFILLNFFLCVCVFFLLFL